MTLIDRFRARHDDELKAIESRYQAVGGAYGDLLLRFSESPAVAWCRNQLDAGLPEWIVVMALANAHLNMVLDCMAGQISADQITRQGARVLQEPRVRTFLESQAAWCINHERLDAALDIGALTVLTRYGAQPRVGRGYLPETFLRVARSVGLFALDVPHTALIPSTTKSYE